MATIGIVAHDAKKLDAVEWAVANKEKLAKFELVGTAGTAKRIKQVTDLELKSLGHGPDGGDVYIAHGILEKNIDALIFFVDARGAHGHEHDIQTLIRTCIVENIPFALNKATANKIIASFSNKPRE
jgi:methylglyoxal synthase